MNKKFSFYLKGTGGLLKKTNIHTNTVKYIFKHSIHLDLFKTHKSISLLHNLR